jgi:hypothetical protein
MTFVVVQNDRLAPVTVYAQNAEGEYTLGVVAPNSTTALAIPEYVMTDGDIDFFVQPRGGFEEDTGVLEVHRGDQVGLVVPPR